MATSTCPACGANAFVAQSSLAGTGEIGGTCSRCGYSSGESNRCPHCNAVARIDGAGVRSLCAMCGGPRIQGNFGGGVAADALREQRRALGNARLASTATILQALITAVATLVGLALLPAAMVGRLIVFTIAVVPLVLALRSRAQATKARENAKNASDRAWQAAAEDVAARAPQGVTVPGLAKTLGIELEHAEKLLTALSVHDRTRIDVGEDAEVRYSVQPDVLVRLGEGAEVGYSVQPDALVHRREESPEDEVAGDPKTLEHGEGRLR